MIAADCPSVSIHGTMTAYTDHDCRCQRARDACSAYQNDRRARVAAGGPNLVSPLGSIRRLQALACMSWPAHALGERMGRDHGQVSRWMAGNEGRPHVLRTTAEMITALYGDLWETEGPSHRAWMMSRRLGWIPPLRWAGKNMDDPRATPWQMGGEPDWAAVEHIAAGLLPWRERTKLERRLAVAKLHRQGLTKNAIGMRLENTRCPDANAERLVQRDVTWLRAAGLVQRRAS